MNTRVRLLIRGRVQGVGFRWFITGIASTLGLAGWIKNLADGTVEVVFEGRREDIEAAMKHCHEGPRSAVVSGINADWSQELEGLNTFDIRY